MVRIKVTETYDLKTTVNKIGILGIHTPNGNTVQRLYPGLCKAYKYIRPVKVDVAMACASVLPADPLQVGVEAGDIAPEDMFNPILYKAVTNSSFDTLVSRIYLNGTSVGDNVDRTDYPATASLDSFKAYYSQLANPKTWRKAMPQAGLSFRGLRPLCHTLLSTYGNVNQPGNMNSYSTNGKIVPNVAEVRTANAGMTGMTPSPSTVNPGQPITLRGKPVKYPKIPLHYSIEDASTTVTPAIPKTMCGVVILPPARLNEFYFRMRVTWTLEFTGIVSMNEIGGATAFNYLDQSSYYSYYPAEASAKLENSEGMVDTTDVSVTKIMES